MKKNWRKESVIYQIYPRSFNDSNGDGIGDIKGIIEKLDYLQLLGIDVIWLSPIFKSPNVDNGYDVSDYFDIMDDFGSMQDFDELLSESHKRNIKIMLDLVVNHSSDEHAWFVESRKSKVNPYRDYYIWKPGKENGEPPNNWGAAWNDAAWKFDETTGEYYLHLFHEKQPDLNWENPKLRQEIYDMMNFWFDKGIDGFRMDVINFISKVPGLPDGTKRDGEKYGNSGPLFLNGPRIHEFLQEMNSNTLSKYDVITVGEMPGVNVDQAKLYTGDDRNELDMVFHFEHVDLGNGNYGKWSPNKWNLSELKTIFKRWQKGLENDGWNSLYWSNHDQPRAISRWGNDSKEYRVISGKMLATLLHTLQGTPYIYQGEELGMTNVHFSDINQYRDVETINAYNELVGEGTLTVEEMMDGIHQRSRDNARTPIQWDSSANAGFTSGTPWIPVNPNYQTINAESALEDEQSIFYYYKNLIQLRKEHEIIVYGRDYESIHEESEEIFSFTRSLQDETLLVICNFTSNSPTFNLPNHLVNKNQKLLISNYTVSTEDNLNNLVLKPYEARVYVLT